MSEILKTAIDIVGQALENDDTESLLDETLEIVHAAALAYFRSHDESMVLVPRTPTAKMIEAGHFAYIEDESDGEEDKWRSHCCWDAMISAIPEDRG